MGPPEAAAASAAHAVSPLERRLSRAMARAITDYGMIAEGDRILVAVSGGKDSYTLLHLLRSLSARAPVSFALKAVNIDQGHPGYPAERLTAYMARERHDFLMVHEDTYSIVTEKIPAGKTYCSLCSRLRRGILYRLAAELGCNKIALGHHRDDILQTLLLNLLFAGQLATMPPRLLGDEGRTTVIRPLAYCAEEDIAAFSEEVGFPILPCDLCGSQDNLQRKVVGEMITDWERRRPGTKAIMMAAVQNVRPSHLLDARLWKALGIEAASEGAAGGVVPAFALVREEREPPLE
jgi:tRNA 2-thiocytidine biosynthesis protein TtcA